MTRPSGDAAVDDPLREKSRMRVVHFHLRLGAARRGRGA